MFDAAIRKLNWERFFRGEGPQAGPITLDRRRVFILPTRQGLIFAVVLMAMLLGAINYNKSLAFGLTFLLASLAVVSILHTFRNLNGLVLRGGRCLPVFAGESARFQVGLENRGGLERLALAVALPGEPAHYLDLQPGEVKWLELERPAERRGRLALGRFTLATRFPLGLFRAWAYADLDLHCLVYPRPTAERGLPEGGVDESAGASGDRGRGHDDFAALRTYHPGDSLRHVHWKALAREQGMLTKQFGGDRVAELWLDWSLLEGVGVEARLSRLTRWVLEADAAHLPYGLRLPGRQVPPDLGEGHRRTCLEALALYGEAA